MKKYKVIIDIREEENPFTCMPENVTVIVEAEKEEYVPKLALDRADIPSNKIYWEMCWLEIE